MAPLKKMLTCSWMSTGGWLAMALAMAAAAAAALRWEEAPAFPEADGGG